MVGNYGGAAWRALGLWQRCLWRRLYLLFSGHDHGFLLGLSCAMSRGMCHCQVPRAGRLLRAALSTAVSMAEPQNMHIGPLSNVNGVAAAPGAIVAVIAAIAAAAAAAAATAAAIAVGTG